MKILMVSDSEAVGGAAVSASRLADGLVRAGHQIVRFVSSRNETGGSWTTVTSAAKDWEKAARRFLPGRLGTTVATWQRAGELRGVIRSVEPDLVNFHNIHSASVPGWSVDLVQVSNAPVVWTLHDMWSVTGGCGQSGQCTAYLGGCSSPCAWIEKQPEGSDSQVTRAWRKKRSVLTNSDRYVAVTPSRWLAGVVATSFWRGHRVEVVPNGLPLGVYKPLDRTLCRAALGLEGECPTLLVVAQRLDDPLKGMCLLRDALPMVRQKPLRILTLGGNPTPLSAEGVSVANLGYVDHERTRVLAYGAADWLVHTSAAENLPNTIMESLACGTPVIGLQVGGVPEMVRPGTTGHLVSTNSPAHLAHTIDEAIANSGSNYLRNSCRRVAESEYDVDLQARRYADLFEDLTKA